MKKSIGLILMLVVMVIKNGAGQTHVQTRTNYQTTTATTISRAFASASTTGNLIVVHLDWDGQTRSISSVTDTKGNSYSKISGPSNWNGVNYRAELWYAYNITAGAAPLTITATLSGAPTSFSQIYMSEYSGIPTTDPLDQTSVAIGNSAAVSSGTKSTTYSNELIYGASIGASGVLTQGAGFTARSNANSNIIEDKNAVAAGAYSANFSSAGGNWVAQMATFISNSSIIILPINLLSFTGESEANKIVLNWITTLETNNAYFTVERSEDGANWQTMGTVQGAGNSSIEVHYSYTTDKTDNAFSYFRLEQTDLDGKSKYFNIIKVNNNDQDLIGLNVYPNPSNGRTLSGKINLEDHEAYTVSILDNLGKIAYHSTFTQPEFTVNFPQTLPSGIYFARISSSTFSAAKIILIAN